jgi:hypothetical protein
MSRSMATRPHATWSCAIIQSVDRCSAPTCATKQLLCRVERPHMQLNSCSVEFGILANKWRILHRPLDVGLEFCHSTIKACCALHNYVRKKDGVNFEDTLYEWPLQCNPSNVRAAHHRLAVRDHFTNYFTSPAGSIPWQYDKV